MTNVQAMTNKDLLTVLVGARSAARMLKETDGRLATLLNQCTATYHVQPHIAAARIQAARELIERALAEQLREGDVLSSPRAVRDYLRLRFAGLGHEVFLGLFLDCRNRLIACEEMFRGTLSQTSVFPREVVKHALRHNAAAVIFSHNHPSGNAEPSTADQALTQTLRQSLALVDVKVLDHLVVGSGSATSFAERGLL